jgi:hypothetical protein
MPESDVSHSTRLLEASTAEAYGISFDEAWYDIPIISRENMIAARLASGWIDSLLTKQAIENGKHGKS